MDLHTIESNGFGIINITGEAQSHEGCRDIHEKALEMLSAGHSIIAVDLRNASYVSASFCGCLVSLYKVARTVGTRILLVADYDSLTYEILSRAFLHEIMEVVPSLNSVSQNILVS